MAAPAPPQGIPLMRRSMPAERRDADGQYGEAASDAAPPSVQPQQQVPYEAWAQPDAQERRREAVSELAGEASAGSDKRRGFNPREDLM